VAISLGSSVSSLREEVINLHDSWQYEYGSTIIIHNFKRDPPTGGGERPNYRAEMLLERERLSRELGRNLSQQEHEDLIEKYQRRKDVWKRINSAEEERKRQTRPWGYTEGEYHFYNVLWIQRKDGIAYRKAAGRVAKDVWETHCKEKSSVILG
jgi:hypothetical protein